MVRMEMGYWSSGPIQPLKEYLKGDKYSLKPLFDSINSGGLSVIMSELVTDPAGLIIISGSLLTGRIGNPNSPYFGQTIESTPTIEDLDIAVIDSYLFSRLPKSELVPDNKLPQSIRGQVSYPVSHPKSTEHIKKIYKKNQQEFGHLCNFFDALSHLKYIPEIGIYRSLKPLFELGLPFNVLHYGSGVSEESILKRYFNQ